MTKDRFFTHRLFSGRRELTLDEREQILDSVIEQTLKEKGTVRNWIFASSGFRMVVAAALLLLISVPVYYAVQSNHADTGGFQERGDGDGVAFAVKCLASGNQRCQMGDRLAFRLVKPDKKGYFAAFGRHKETGTIVWYYPAAPDAQSISIEKATKDGWFRAGVAIGDEHSLGEFDIVGVYSDIPLNRDDIRQLVTQSGDEQGQLFSAEIEVVK